MTFTSLEKPFQAAPKIRIDGSGVDHKLTHTNVEEERALFPGFNFQKKAEKSLGNTKMAVIK